MRVALDCVGPGTRLAQPLLRVPVPARSKAPPCRKHSKTQPLRHPSLECWRLRPLWITSAREHALPAAPTCSHSDAIQSSGKPEALQNTAAPPPKFGVLALATALDDVGSGTRPPSRSYEFPFRRDPKLRHVGSTPKHSRFATQVWSAGACALATALDDVGSGTRPPSRSHEFPFRRDPKLRHVGSTPKHGRFAT